MPANKADHRKAFHLPLPNLGLPIVFLPAKFDTEDPLQRLGIAFMAKGGVPPVGLGGVKQPQPEPMTEDAGPTDTTRKRRRKSSSAATKDIAPATPAPGTRRKSAPVRPGKLTMTTRRSS
jgi:hypothetical protein